MMNSWSLTSGGSGRVNMAHRRQLASPKWDWFFDSGSAVTVADENGKIRITPKKHWSNTWAWWAIRSNRMGGKKPTFVIDKANHYGLTSGEWLCCWATRADTDTWYNFDNVTIGASDLEFSNNAPFPNGMIYLAAMPMYPFSRSQRLASEWLNNSLVSLPSAIGQQTRRDNADGRTAAAFPYIALKMTGTRVGTKNNGILLSGSHPSETIGRWQFEGAIEWLLTPGVMQSLLLDYFNWYIYPCIQPQATAGGWFRSSPQAPTVDNNRIWDTTGTYEVVDAFKAAWTAHTSDVFEVAFDYHSWMDSDGARSLAYDSTTTKWVAFLARMAILRSFTKRTDDTNSLMLKAYWITKSSTKLYGAIDHGGITSSGVSTWKAVGADTMKATAYMLAGGYFTNSPSDVGSRNFNGTTDRLDRTNVYDPAGKPVSMSAWFNSNGVADSNSDYILQIQASGDAAYGCAFYVRNSGTAGECRDVGFTADGPTDILHLGHSSTNLVGVWHHACVTWDGTFTNANTVHIYLDGVEMSYSSTQHGVAPEVAHTGKMCIGGRTFDDSRNFNGMLAQVGMWNRVLTSGEISNLATGYAPNLAAPSGLLTYFKGNTSDLHDVIDNALWTTDGTTSISGAGNGPGIFY